jgi:CoA:oxalate CoA-transferase
VAGALDGIKVLDLSRFIAGPLCGMVLGDMGADVVKVERREKGEDARAVGPFVDGESLYTLTYNRNKRGLTLDYRNPDAQDLLRDLVAKADIVIENFRAGTMEKMGCGWDVVHALNPRTIMVRISGFGQDGPFAERPCFDVITQAMSGLMEMTGEVDGPPVPSGTFLVDQVTGLYAAIGTLGALNARERTGEGQVVETALLDSATTLLLTAIPEKILLGRESSRQGARDRYSSPANNYRCQDGRFVHLVAGNAALFPRLVALMQRPELLSDPRFVSHASRMEHAAEIEAIVGQWVAQHDSDELVAMLARADVPCSKIATVGELIDNPQIAHRNQIINVEHSKIGAFPMANSPVRMSSTKPDAFKAAPSIGEDNYDVLQDWLGYSRDRIDALLETKII